jgi:hypothetical protein
MIEARTRYVAVCFGCHKEVREYSQLEDAIAYAVNIGEYKNLYGITVWFCADCNAKNPVAKTATSIPPKGESK